MSRKDRRNNDPEVIKKREQFVSPSQVGGLITVPVTSGPGSGSKDAGGWGVGAPGAKPATGQTPYVNPFIVPKAAGINIMSNTYPSNYYVEWNLSSWRSACDQAIKMGFTMPWATLTSWTYEASAFVQSLFTKLGTALDKIAFFVIDDAGNKMDDMTEEFCTKPYQRQIMREILFSYFWGFTGLNFDPFVEKVYKYPMQDIDPISRMLRQSTYSFYDGMRFADNDNLLFVQPSTSTEAFLGWMQPITRAFIQINQSKNNWLAAGRRLAWPLLTVGYPQDDGGRDGMGNATNPYKDQAIDVASSIDPSKGLVYPYIRNAKGEIEKTIEVEFESPKSGTNMHKVFSEFNDAEKNEIREMIFGGTLSSSNDSGGTGSRALGEVHERMFDSVAESKVDFVVSILNSDFKPKISKWYKNLPQNWKYSVNKSKELTLDEMVQLSTVVTQNGKRLTPAFFEANGLSIDFIEDAPVPTMGGGFGDDPDAEDKPGKEVKMAQQKRRSLFGSSKKK